MTETVSGRQPAIPKIIHCFWFGGGEMPPLAVRCVESWKKYCSDYEIKFWNEENYDVTKNAYMHQSYQNGKYGFTVDYARLDVIYRFGGIYFDTDVELLKPIDDLLYDEAFMGFETEKTICLGQGFGAAPNNGIILKLREAYNDLSFVNVDGSLNLTPSPSYQTAVMRELGLNGEGKEQVIDGCRIYPKTVFNPCDIETMIVTPSADTVSIHHFMASWATESQRRHTRLYARLSRTVGKKTARALKKAYRSLRKRS